MNLKTLAQNARRLRTGKGLSQAALAGLAGLSLPAIKNLEGAKSQPRMNTVEAIARALDVKLEELFLPVRELKTVRFRSSKRMQNRENILASVSRWMDDFNFLEQILDDHIRFQFSGMRGWGLRSNAIAVAGKCRSELGLGPKEPIHDICGLLEHAGVKVYPLSSASEDFFGLSVAQEDGGPAVVVNNWERISVERRIFSAVHELGHLVLHRTAYDVTQVAENRTEEQEADLFAGHFLMPDEGFRSEWADGAGLFWLDRVFKVKRIFHVSYKTVLKRLIEYGDTDDGIWRTFNAAYARHFRRRLSFKEEPMGISSTEPFSLQKFDFYEDRYRRLARKAVEEGRISISRGAEILRISVNEMQDLLNDWGSAS